MSIIQKFIFIESNHDTDTGKTTMVCKIPTGQPQEPIAEMHILLSCISLYIKGLAKEGINKDYILLEEAIDHLTSEFASTTDCEDSGYNKK